MFVVKGPAAGTSSGMPLAAANADRQIGTC